MFNTVTKMQGGKQVSASDVSVVLVHGAWADGSSWSKIIAPLAAEGVTVTAPSLPLTSLQDDVAALERALARVSGPVVLAGNAYAGAVISAARSGRVRATRATHRRELP